MPRPKPTEPTEDEHGFETHPSWATIRASRVSVSPPGAHLFDSDIFHQHTMRVSIGGAVRKRELGHDWVHGQIREEFIEIEMSEAQWASFVSTPNSGSGTPCTVRYVNGQDVPEAPYDPRLALTMGETKEAADRAFKHILEDFEKLEETLRTGTAKQRKDALFHFRCTLQNATPNVTYAGKTLIEQTENVVLRAKADIESYVVAKAQQLGIDTAALGQVHPLALPTAEPTEPDDIIDAETLDQPYYLEEEPNA